MGHAFTDTLHAIIIAGIDALNDKVSIDKWTIVRDGDKILINSHVGIITITAVESSFMDDRRTAVEVHHATASA